MIGHRAHGYFLLSTGHICGRARAFRSLDSALRACRASSAGHAIWPRRPGGSLVLSVGDLVVAWPSRCRTCRHKTRTHGCARDGPSCHFDVCAGLRIYVSYPPRELRGSKRASYEEVIALAEEKNAFVWKTLGLLLKGRLFGLTGKASNAVEIIASEITAMRSTGSTFWMTLYLSYLARAHAELRQFDEAWR